VQLLYLICFTDIAYVTFSQESKYCKVFLLDSHSHIACIISHLESGYCAALFVDLLSIADIIYMKSHSECELCIAPLLGFHCQLCLHEITFRM